MSKKLDAIDRLLRDLDAISIIFDMTEYGLPCYPEGTKVHKYMRQTVRQFLKKQLKQKVK